MPAVSTYHDLEQSLGLTQPLSVNEKWSAAPDFLKIVSDWCLQNKPQVIVECSSGTSSLVLARCCQINEFGHVYSLENGDEFAAKTRGELLEYSLEHYCDVIYTPLTECNVSGRNFQWYDLAGLPDINIDLLVVDGPPGFIQKNSRYPAIPLLHAKFGDNSTVFLDDAARDDEQQIVDQWLEEFPEFCQQYIETERGCAVLTRS